MYGNIRRTPTSAAAGSICLKSRLCPQRLRSPRSKIAGQALILVVIGLLVLCLGLIVLFDTGQVVTKKVQLVNTADAAAYSAAVQEARSLNLIAYMNRASVANEVAMAQMVSWYSWTNFAISATDHMADALQVIAIVTAVFGVGVAIEEAVQALQEAKNGLVEGRNVEQELFDVAATAIADLNGVYSQASRVIADGGAADAANVARNIVSLNDPQASVTTLGLGILAQDAFNANAYIKRYAIPTTARSGVAVADRYKNVVMEARDPFSRQRNGSFLFGWIKKYGGTDLVSYHSWVGIDTLNISFTCPVFICGLTGFPPHPKGFNIPIAWGGGAAVDRQTTSFASLARQDQGWTDPFIGNDPQYANRRNYAAYSNALGNGAASGLALSQPAENGTPWIKPQFIFSGATVGLPDYNDIAPNKATVPYDNGKSASANGVAVDVGPTFTVLVAQPMNTVPTSSNVQGIGGPPDFQVTDKSVANGMTAMSSAQVYFSRPRSLFPRLIDSNREMGSLFSPYWQARLIDTPYSIRQEVALSNGAVAP